LFDSAIKKAQGNPNRGEAVFIDEIDAFAKKGLGESASGSNIYTSVIKELLRQMDRIEKKTSI
jgi:ATP-dependent 26S proteasome regulatory subunit